MEQRLGAKVRSKKNAGVSNRNPVPSVRSHIESRASTHLDVIANRGDVLCRFVLPRSFLFFPEPPLSSSSFFGNPRRILFSRMNGNRFSISFAIPKVSSSPICRDHSSLLRPPRRFSGFPGDFPCSPILTGTFSFISFAIPKVLLFPDLSGTFSSPSSDEL